MKNYQLIAGLSLMAITSTWASQAQNLPEKENSWVRFCHKITYPTKRMIGEDLVIDTFEKLYAHANPTALYKGLESIWSRDIRLNHALNEERDAVKALVKSKFDLKVAMTKELIHTGSFSREKSEQIAAVNREMGQISSRAMGAKSVALIDEDDLPNPTNSFAYKDQELFSQDELNQLNGLSQAIASDKAFFNPHNKAAQNYKPQKYQVDSLKTDLRSSFKRWMPLSNKFAINRFEVLMGVCGNDWVRSNTLEDLQKYFNEQRKNFPTNFEQFSPDQRGIEITYAHFSSFKENFDQTTKKGMVFQTLHDIQKLEDKLTANPENEKVKVKLELARKKLNQNPITYVLSIAPTLQMKRFVAEAMGYELTHLESYLKDTKYFPNVRELNVDGFKILIGLHKPLSNHNILQILKLVIDHEPKVSKNNFEMISQLHAQEEESLKELRAHPENLNLLAEPTPYVEFWSSEKVLSQLTQRLIAHQKAQ